ncbi:MAG: serine hydrolase [Hyphomicrobiales bacterium]|nr:serine hydrolase [Hyphomicrobiales bacterium]
MLTRQKSASRAGRLSLKRTIFAAVCAASFAALAHAEDAPKLPDAKASDPKTLGLMQGSPPAPDKIVRFENSYRFPATRWSFSHMRELTPTANVWRGEAQAHALKRAIRPDLERVAFKTTNGVDMTFGDLFDKTYADGLIVLHKGRIVYERYGGALTPERPHMAMSVTKSFVGLLAAMAVAAGKLDDKALVVKYLPELKDTAYGDATVRDVMDMTVGVKYSENYADPNAEIWSYARAGGMIAAPADYKGARNFYDYLKTLQKEGEHDKAFAYKTVNAETLAWILKRATGKSLSDLLSTEIWRKLGAENDAYFLVDSTGVEAGGGGLNMALRDMARFGEMIRNGGSFNGQQIVPRAVVDDLFKGADKAKFAKAGFATLPGWSYHNMWWVSHNDHGAIAARGIHGQVIYIDPAAKMVIARFGSHPIAANGFNDPISLPAYAAMANALK